MTATRLYLRDLTSQEYRAFLYPNTLASLLVLLALILNIGINGSILPAHRDAVIAISLVAAIYITIYSFYIIPIRKNKDLLIWFNAIFSGAGFWALAYFLQDELLVYQNLLLYVSVISISTFSKRPATLTMILLASASHFFFHPEAMATLLEWVRHLGVPLVAVLIAETAIRIQDISRQQVQRLETIKRVFLKSVCSQSEHTTNAGNVNNRLAGRNRMLKITR